MPVDYSKWDKIELSDDSDIEVHPNVDKRSFINAKRRQIHEQREQRKMQIKRIRTEREINEALLGRIEKLLRALRAQTSTPQANDKPDEVVFRTLIETSATETEDKPAGDPIEGGLTYSKMISTLVDQVKKELEGKDGKEKFEGYLTTIERHYKKIQEMHAEAAVKLAELEKEERSKITMDDIHDGFNASQVNRSNVPLSQPSNTSTKKKTVETVEQLNPGVKAPTPESIAKKRQETEDDDLEPASELALRFAQIKPGRYNELLSFIRDNREIVAEKNTDALLVEAFTAEMEGRSEYAKQCVHQALLLQYCRTLGPDGISLFFKRITTQGHQAQKVFLDDVSQTYNRIHLRGRELAKQKNEDVEQIQLHAVDPGTAIAISVPPKNPQTDEERQAREIFESFPLDMQQALETRELDEVNKVLGKMKVVDAEKMVEMLSAGGMLALESEIIDATTDEGKEKLKHLEEEVQQRKEALFQPEDGPITEVAEEEVGPSHSK
ncbi:Hsp90 co-chaperone Cdc37 [Ascobolus immersus RN42]|uniref:Hsp90 chaperone protein kinase-targeting subunit n=1 Tax=Ascobolus immersus RN42 TaxID=1160509 RepID=A0A3N4IFX3_ASCIM|nr:Hsp90 co-chaperone Cdc37 [Ascobolus immersus RN42]